VVVAVDIVTQNLPVEGMTIKTTVCFLSDRSSVSLAKPNDQEDPESIVE
jgi:hypothetical protein